MKRRQLHAEALVDLRRRLDRLPARSAERRDIVRQAMGRWLAREPGVVRAMLAENAGHILKEIGVDAGDDVRLVLAEVDDPRHQLVWTEQLMPVIPIHSPGTSSEMPPISYAPPAISRSRPIDR